MKTNGGIFAGLAGRNSTVSRTEFIVMTNVCGHTGTTRKGQKNECKREENRKD